MHSYMRPVMRARRAVSGHHGTSRTDGPIAHRGLRGPERFTALIGAGLTGGHDRDGIRTSEGRFCRRLRGAPGLGGRVK